jgi:glycosyltransferase involved in cell wall biosynthesis
VYFAGFVPDDELPLYYQAADLFVLPTRSLEGFGLITLEAFASELPVVGTPVEQHPSCWLRLILALF